MLIIRSVIGANESCYGDFNSDEKEIECNVRQLARAAFPKTKDLKYNNLEQLINPEPPQRIYRFTKPVGEEP